MAYSTIQMCPKKMPPVLTTPVVHLEPRIRIYLRIVEQNLNGPNGILRAWGKLIHEKKSEVENLMALFL
jgi:hypothetical protein